MRELPPPEVWSMEAVTRSLSVTLSYLKRMDSMPLLFCS